ncbi:endonuclease/exonuclease/phosphatase family protein [Portibacter marinus]|uniref:endonuclease/exonuclease/phosphatase family protein n=1 Tax=Portibacter marinus TaxID=2898660 RepID=UPI001F3515D4|nr:endonuclease/exonuclease/phosphatase family protein [Portibacter marinus]
MNPMTIIVYCFILFSVVGTFLPYLDCSHWIVRGQSYFRAVYLGLNALLLVITLIFLPFTWLTIAAILLLVAAIVACLISVLPFTPLNSIEVPFKDKKDAKNSLNILVFNVYQFNDQYQNLVDLVLRIDPDVVFLIETNTDWAKGVNALKKHFPYHFDEIRENTYGLMFFTKRELLEGGINYLVKPTIPSAEALLNIEGVKVRILGLHPKPPFPGEAETTHYKDRELAQAARYFKAQKEDDHQILIGDLNDVAWSRASLYYKKASGMKDPRVGRGFYSTFPTWFPIKIPLDHVFCSPGLELIDFKVLEDIGSDHYPVNVEFHVPK